MDKDLLNDMIINTNHDHEIPEPEKEEYNKKTREKTIDVQKWLLESYVIALYSTIENGTKKAKCVKIAEILLLSSIIIDAIMTTVLIISSLINPKTTSSYSI